MPDKFAESLHRYVALEGVRTDLDGAPAEVRQAVVTLTYTNWKGVTGTRQVVPDPGSLRFGTTEHHPEPTWLIDAFDVGKQAVRTFALNRVQVWV